MSNSPVVTVIDYGVGNLLSVQRALEHIGSRVVFSSNANEIQRAERVILPGVGAFRSAMEKLEVLGLVPTMKTLAELQTPLLGICLGMEILFDSSEEFGITVGLGLIPGRIEPISRSGTVGQALKVPHIGWNSLLLNEDSMNSILDQELPIFQNTIGRDFYFVHSYQAKLTDSGDCFAYALHGGNQIPAIVNRGNVFGVQFHPEKSGEDGLNLLEIFTKI
jgi:glutamine amidotransferase